MDTSPQDLSRESRVDAVLAGYFARAQAGQSADWHDLLAEHPDLAVELEEYFRGEEAMFRLADPLRPASAASGGATPTQVLGRLERADVDQAPQVVPGYEILETIGVGGMGIVYKARQVGLDRLVALKMIRGGGLSTTEDRERFRREAEAVARLDHPNIVPIFEIGECDSRPFFTMKLLPGSSLAERMSHYVSQRRQGLQLLTKVARAVQHAHDRGILHRDLKPANILLAPGSEQSDEPYLGDFGLAKLAGTSTQLTQSGAVLGTPSYMAPEQASASHAVGPEADVYSLGAILYHLLTGRRPFEADTPVATLLQVQTAHPVEPRILDRTIDRDLETICLKCLNKNPRDRYASAEAFATDLERWLQGISILARRQSAPLQAWRWLQRHPRAIYAAAITVSILACVLLGFGYARLHRKHQQDNIAAQERDQLRKCASDLHEAEKLAATNRNAALQLLADVNPSVRGWEWHLLHQRIRATPSIFRVDKDYVYLIDFSTDGRWLAAGGAEPGVKIWDVARATEARVLPTKRVRFVAFCSANQVVAVTDRSIEIWDVDTGDLHQSFGRGERIVGAALQPGGKSLALCSTQIEIMDIETGKTRQILPVPGASQVLFGPKGRLLAVLVPHEVQIWDVDKKKIVAKLPAADHLLTFDSTGRVLISKHSSPTQLLACDTATGKTLESVTDASQDDAVYCGRISPDGRTLLTATQRAIQVRDPRSLALQASLARDADTPIWSVCFSADGGHFAVTSGRDVLLYESAPILEAPYRALENRAALDFALSHDQRCLAIVDDKDLKILDTATGRERCRVPRQDKAKCVTLNADGSRVTIPVAGQLRSHDTTTGALQDRVQVAEDILCLACDETGAVVAGTETGKVLVWQQGGTRSQARHEGRVLALAIHGTSLATAGDDKTLRIGSISPDSTTTSIALPAAAHDLAWSPDARSVVVACSNRRAHLVDVESRSITATFEHKAAVTRVVFSPDGSRILTASADAVLRVWEPRFGLILTELRHSNAAIWSLGFLPQCALLTGDGKSTWVLHWSGKAARDSR